MGFRLFVLLGRRSGDVSSMLWGTRGTLVSWANCCVCVPPSPAPPRCPSVRPDPTRPWYVRVLDPTHCFKSDFLCPCFRKDTSKIFLLVRCPGMKAGTVVPLAHRPAAVPFRPNQPCPALIRTARGIPGLWNLHFFENQTFKLHI